MQRYLKSGFVTLMLTALVGGLWIANAGGGRDRSVMGTGRMGDPIQDVTISSASDFGFAVSDGGGTFVCSMGGPETGGFAGFRVMTVEGPVAPGSLQVRGRLISFSGQATVVLIPGMQGASHTGLDNIDYKDPPRTGNDNQAQRGLNNPALT